MMSQGSLSATETWVSEEDRLQLFEELSRSSSLPPGVGGAGPGLLALDKGTPEDWLYSPPEIRTHRPSRLGTDDAPPNLRTNLEKPRSTVSASDARSLFNVDHRANQSVQASNRRATVPFTEPPGVLRRSARVSSMGGRGMAPHLSEYYPPGTPSPGSEKEARGGRGRGGVPRGGAVSRSGTIPPRRLSVGGMMESAPFRTSSSSLQTPRTYQRAPGVTQGYSNPQSRVPGPGARASGSANEAAYPSPVPLSSRPGILRRGRSEIAAAPPSRPRLSRASTGALSSKIKPPSTAPGAAPRFTTQLPHVRSWSDGTALKGLVSGGLSGGSTVSAGGTGTAVNGRAGFNSSTVRTLSFQPSVDHLAVKRRTWASPEDEGSAAQGAGFGGLSPLLQSDQEGGEQLEEGLDGGPEELRWMQPRKAERTSPGSAAMPRPRTSPSPSRAVPPHNSGGRSGSGGGRVSPGHSMRTLASPGLHPAAGGPSESVVGAGDAGDARYGSSKDASNAASGPPYSGAGWSDSYRPLEAVPAPTSSSDEDQRQQRRRGPWTSDAETGADADVEGESDFPGESQAEGARVEAVGRGGSSGREGKARAEGRERRIRNRRRSRGLGGGGASEVGSSDEGSGSGLCDVSASWEGARLSAEGKAHPEGAKGPGSRTDGQFTEGSKARPDGAGNVAEEGGRGSVGADGHGGEEAAGPRIPAGPSRGQNPVASGDANKAEDAAGQISLRAGPAVAKEVVRTSPGLSAEPGSQRSADSGNGEGSVSARCRVPEAASASDDSELALRRSRSGLVRAGHGGGPGSERGDVRRAEREAGSRDSSSVAGSSESSGGTGSASGDVARTSSGWALAPSARGGLADGEDSPGAAASAAPYGAAVGRDSSRLEEMLAEEERQAADAARRGSPLLSAPAAAAAVDPPGDDSPGDNRPESDSRKGSPRGGSRTGKMEPPRIPETGLTASEVALGKEGEGGQLKPVPEDRTSVNSGAGAGGGDGKVSAGDARKPRLPVRKGAHLVPPAVGGAGASTLQRRLTQRRMIDRAGTPTTTSETYEWERSSFADETYSDVSTPSTRLSRKTLEEAAEAAIFISSMVHDLVYKAGTLAQEKADLARLEKASGELRTFVAKTAIRHHRRDSSIGAERLSLSYTGDIGKQVGSRLGAGLPSGLMQEPPRSGPAPACGCVVM